MEPMLQRPAYVASIAKCGASVPAYAYAFNNPLHYTDETGLFALKGKCSNWAEALEEAKERAGCGTGRGGGNDRSCACSKKLQDCGSGSCDICKILENAEPATIVTNLKCEGLDSSGCSHRNNQGYL
ncbi:MAG: hypothetical protein IT352_16245 [Gemmatimonadales bacterium]|nr:hypothetical protein [Gemmatimonadales bacterium]